MVLNRAEKNNMNQADYRKQRECQSEIRERGKGLAAKIKVNIFYRHLNRQKGFKEEAQPIKD